MITACIVGMLGLAHAGPFTHKTMQGPWPERQVQRGLVLPKGWLEVGLAADTKQSDDYRGTDGVIRPQPPGVNWRYSRLWLEIRQGFSSRVSLYARVPWVMSELQPVGGNEIQTIAMGDAHTGLVFQPWDTGPHSVAFSADLKAPSGVEWPSGAGGPQQTVSFLTGTGITNVGLFAHGKVVAGTWGSASMDVGYVHKFPGIVGYVIQVDGFGNGYLNPGNEVRLGGSLTGQMGSMIAVTAGANWWAQGEAQIGISGPGTSSLQLSPIRHTSGDWLDGSLAISVEPTQHWEFELNAEQQLLGSDTRPFAHLGLEEFSPQPGWRWGVRMVSRW